MSKSIDEMVADLLRETASWESIDLQLTVAQTLYVQIGRNPPRTSVASEHFVETAQGQKLYQCVDGEPGTERVVWLGYCDGARCAYVEHERAPHQDQQHAITITRTFMNEQSTGYTMRPEPIRFQFLGLVPLHEVVKKASRTGPDHVLGRECERLLFSAVPGSGGTQELVYYLDALTSVPLKVEAFANQDRLKDSKPNWVWEATSFDEVQGFHVALNSRYTGFIFDGTGSYIKQLTNEYKMTSLVYNKNHRVAEFWPAYDKGVKVADLIEGKTYYNTPDKKAPSEVLTRTAAAPGSPIAAAEPADFTSWFAGGGLVLGCALLAAAITTWVRRR